MNKHFKYLRYIILHKWYVFIECCKLGIPFAGIVHDLSKLTPSEWGPYAHTFYGRETACRPDADGDKAEKLAFDIAWNHHQKRNPHHWQYWVLLEDSGKVVPLPMPERYRREMLADWRGAGRAIKGVDDTKTWYVKNRDNMILHATTRNWIEQQLGIVW